MKHIATSVLVLAVALAQAAERARPSHEELERARRYREFASEVQFGRTPAGAVVTYTNFDGMVLGLALSAPSPKPVVVWRSRRYNQKKGSI